MSNILRNGAIGCGGKAWLRSYAVCAKLYGSGCGGAADCWYRVGYRCDGGLLGFVGTLGGFVANGLVLACVFGEGGIAGTLLLYFIMRSANSLRACCRLGCSWIMGLSCSAVVMFQAARVIMSWAVMVGMACLVGKNSTVSVILSARVRGM